MIGLSDLHSTQMDSRDGQLHNTSRISEIGSLYAEKETSMFSSGDLKELAINISGIRLSSVLGKFSPYREIFPMR